MVLYVLVFVVAVGEVYSAALAGCSHDGKFYSSGSAIVVACTDCTCQSGEIKCPEKLVCPKSCHYQSKEHEHGSSWLAFCNTCSCDDGVITCDQRQCENSCDVDMGMTILKGDTFKRDCNTCTCQGNDMISCTKKTCHCTDPEKGTVVANGGFYKDSNCNQCVCKDGEIKCASGNSCRKGCFLNNKRLVDGGKMTIGCFVFQCNDGNPTVIKNNCF